ncbi:adenylate/guanylate cyclase domain-containing protein [Roseicella aerolata]|uniref:Adenylate/guanylate cyclase domain-containing protein n=1 Tax=Roseicella aerolata TaxID=2883479 RepID=A0A9X1L7T0_9PROT|nr:adenylate/guanylate cyclase domain-containing protein [Roseicella aerolata]MCB4822311.1 adenylate/guanylate cyclase domain-containing protein [Roseicella aerolata]
MRAPETHYARSGDVRIAYQVFGNGPFDLVFVPGFISNIDHYWDHPGMAHTFSRLASFCRLITFDKRGTGLSDRVGGLPTLEQRMDDLRAVMDAVGSERAALLGISEGGAMSMLFAATHPDRVRSLVLYGCYAHFHSWVLPPERFGPFLDAIDRDWGTGESLRAFAPSAVADEWMRNWWARYERVSASPSAALALMRMNAEIDVRHVLPAIHVPTLVIHRTGDTRVSVEGGRYLAEHIAGARYRELPGEDHLLWVGDTDRAITEIEEFLTGAHSDADPERVLATVLFTDIVGSTQRAAELGDRRWRLLLAEHNGIARREIARFRGREVHSLGDGFLATFDGPARAVRCACAIAETVRTSLGIKVRGGVHTGEIELDREESDVRGIAVHIAARIAALAGAGEVLVSGTVRDLVAGSGIRFRGCGSRTLKGVPGKVRLYAPE